MPVSKNKRRKSSKPAPAPKGLSSTSPSAPLSEEGIAELAPARNALKEGRWSEAINAYGAFVAAHQDHHVARLEMLRAAADAVRQGARFPRPPMPPQPSTAPTLSVVVCSIDDERHAASVAMYQRLLAEYPHEILSIRDARSLCEAYTRATRQAKGDILVFSHDDVEFLGEDFAARLIGHLQNHDVVGFAGTAQLKGPAWIQSGWRAARGQVATIDKTSGTLRVDVYGVSGVAESGVQALDGLCIACRREVAEQVGFDADTFDGFHLYDTDFTYRAYRAGYRLAVVNDIPVIHRSTGRLDATWQGFAERFLKKFPDGGFTGSFGENPLRAVAFDQRDHVIAYNHAMLAIAAAFPGSLAPASGAALAQMPAPTSSAAETPIQLAMPWTLTEIHGWGLVGVHTALYLLDQGQSPLLLSEPKLSTMRPSTQEALRPAVESYRQLEPQLTASGESALHLPRADVLHPLGNALLEESTSRRFRGRRNIGVIAFEKTKLDDAALARGRSYDFIITHSTYNMRLLQDAGLSDVRLAFQGIDESDMVRYEPRRIFGNRFVVFSGGKLEFRKGQDLVVEAFKRFHARHPDALLVAAWHNPWPHLSLDITGAPYCRTAPQIENGRLQMTRWVMDQGLPPEAFLDLGFLLRPSIPAILAECAAALFPNRCEGGTNLVAMEAMACGVPCVISANTGHLDIIRESNSYPLHRQSALPNPNGEHTGWGESDVDEIVERLEEVYRDRSEAKARGERAATFIRSERTWRKFAEVFVAEALR